MVAVLHSPLIHYLKVQLIQYGIGIIVLEKPK